MFNVGDQVEFGRPNGEKTVGTVIKVNRKSLKIRQDESRGSQRTRTAGTTWNVHPSFVTKLDGTGSVSPRVPSTVSSFRVGNKVSFTTRSGKTITGHVKRVNRKTYSVNPVGETGNRYWRVSKNMVKAA